MDQIFAMMVTMEYATLVSWSLLIALREMRNHLTIVISV